MFKFKNYKYNLIIIKIVNSDDYDIIQKYLHEQGIPWASGDNSIIKYRDLYDYTYLYVHLKNASLQDDSHLMYSNSLDANYISRYEKDPNIYTMNDINKIKSIIEYGVLLPSYKPKKIKRTI